MTGDPVLAAVPCGPLLRVFAGAEWGVGTATFSHDEVYRYRLSRVWDAALPRVNFLMLNPSTADEAVLDPTVRRCVGFAKDWGMGACEVTNAFALRSTDPRGLRAVDDPVGPVNDDAIIAAAKTSAFTVAAWGTHARLHGRELAVRALLAEHDIDVRALLITKGGHPGHPLYLPGSSVPQKWVA